MQDTFIQCLQPQIYFGLYKHLTNLSKLCHSYWAEVFAEEVPCPESVATRLARYERLLQLQVELNVGLYVTQSLLGHSADGAGEGGVGIHEEVLIDPLVHLRHIHQVASEFVGKQNILLNGEVLKIIF